MPSDTFSPYADAISGIESGGNYGALGPPTASGDRAYGKYQIMGANIPSWTEQHMGKRLTPQEFLADPQAQDATFNGQFNQYVQKYGPEGAAQAWIGGPGGVGKLDRKDSLGTSVGVYGQRFMKALGAPSSVQAMNTPVQPVNDTAPLPQAAPSVPVSSQGMPAYGWSPNNAPAPVSGGPPSMPQPEPLQAMQPLGAPIRRPPPDLTQLQAFLSRTQPSAGFRFSRG